MGKYTQDQRPLALTTPLGKDELLLVGLTGTEEISQPFSFQLDLLAEKETSIAFDRLLGHKVAVRFALPGQRERFINGIVKRLTQGGFVNAADGRTTFVHFRAEIVPQLWLLTKKLQSRIFQQINVPGILKQILQQEWNLDVRFEIQGDFVPRDYCVQYRESDFQFVSRLMEEEGIFYFFDHSSNDHQLVLANASGSHPALTPAASVLFEETAGGNLGDDRIYTWEKSQEISSGKYTLWDYCFEMPKKNLAADRQIQESVAVGTDTHSLRVAGNDKFEIYEYPGRYAQRFDGVAPSGTDQSAHLQNVFDDNQRTAAIRIQQEAARGLAIRGESNCRQMVTGARFTLERHPYGDGEYVLTRIEHLARMPGAYVASDETAFEYSNHFECLPMALPFRPERVTPKPVISGAQTAVVVGPAGQNIFLDKYGRVKVQFHWDRLGQNNADSSCWIRVGQLWAGQRWGAFFWPRIGHEVIVAFEEGDPDQPIIVGSVYNAANMPPFELPSESMVGGIKSCSFGASANPAENFNGVVFYDALGDEHVQVHSERHDIINSESTRVIHVGESHMKMVGGFGVGSGSGGGSEPPSTTASTTPVPTWSWSKTTPTGTFSADGNLTIGVTMSAVTPLEVDSIIGSYFQVIINPLGWLGELGPEFGAAELTGWQSFGMGVTAMLGAVTFCIGATTGLSYGPQFMISRGTEISYNGPIKEWETVLASVTAALYAATPIVAGLFPNKFAEMMGSSLGMTGAAGIALAALTSIETKTAYAANITAKADEAQALSDKITTVATPIATGLVDTAEQNCMTSIALTNQALGTVRATATQAVATTRTFQSNYTVNAWNISLNSSADPDPTNLALVLPTATSINISAQGLGPAHLTGTLQLTGTQQACMTSGLGNIGVYAAEALGNVVINCGPLGILTLQRGPEDDMQMIQMTEGSISIVQYTVGNISIQVMEGNIHIQAGAAQINLNGETGAISIEGGTINLTALEGITLQVEENSIAVNAGGVEITGLNTKISAEVAHQLQTLSAQAEADEFLNSISMGIFS